MSGKQFSSKSNMHEAEFSKRNKVIALYNIKRKVLASSQRYYDIIVKEIANLEGQTIRKMPKCRYLADSVCRKRNKK